MSVYDDGLRAEIAQTLADVQTELVASGLMFREYEVKLATATTTGADPAAGNPGTQTVSYLTLTPRPDVKLEQVYRWNNGISTLIGDGKLTISRTACTENQLKGAAWVEIGGVKYTLVDGSIKQTAMFWAVVVKREQQ